MWYVYILKTESGKFYTGITDNLQRRFNEHQSGKGGHYTKYDRVEILLYSEKFDNRQKAEDREKQIKRWSRNKKRALIERDVTKLKMLSMSRDRGQYTSN